MKIKRERREKEKREKKEKSKQGGSVDRVGGSGRWIGGSVDRQIGG